MKNRSRKSGVMTVRAVSSNRDDTIALVSVTTARSWILSGSICGSWIHCGMPNACALHSMARSHGDIFALLRGRDCQRMDEDGHCESEGCCGSGIFRRPTACRELNSSFTAGRSSHRRREDVHLMCCEWHVCKDCTSVTCVLRLHVWWTGIGGMMT